MFRPVRRKSRAIDDDQARQVLHDARRGVLAVNGDDGYPYAVPINFFYDEASQKIYFHGAHAGYKVEALAVCDKVCFTAYGDEVVKDPDAAWAPYLKSVVVFGRCRRLGNGEEAAAQLHQLAAKYYPTEELIEQEMSAGAKAALVWEITIEHLTGKEICER